MILDTTRCHGCGGSIAVPSAIEYGGWVQCQQCGTFVSSLRSPPPPVVPTPSGPPPGWAPVLPMKPNARFIFGTRDPAVRVFLTTCRRCRAWLAMDRHTSTFQFIRCGVCRDRSSLVDHRLDRHVFVRLHDVGSLYADFVGRELDVERISLPTRAAPTRAWIERDFAISTDPWVVRPLLDAVCSLAPLGIDATLEAREGWFLKNAWSNAPVPSGETIAPGVWFGQNGAHEPRDDYPALDERPADPAAWQIWADHLEEHDDGALASWVLSGARTPMALSDQLGFLAPLVRRGLARVTWNAFGYVERLVIGGRVLRFHPFVLDARFVPAVRYLQSVRIELETPQELTPMCVALASGVFPRSLRRIELSGSAGEVSAFNAVVQAARRQCPWFGT